MTAETSQARFWSRWSQPMNNNGQCNCTLDSQPIVGATVVDPSCPVHGRLQILTFVPQFHGGDDRKPARFSRPTKERRSLL